MLLDVIALSSSCVTALDVKWIHLILIKQQNRFCPLENNQGGFLTYAKQSDQINILWRNWAHDPPIVSTKENLKLGQHCSFCEGV